MTNNDTGIDQSTFLAKVAARKREQAENAHTRMAEALVGYSTSGDETATHSADRVDGSANGHARKNGIPRPPRIPPLNLQLPTAVPPNLAKQMQRDMEEMYEDFNTERSELDIAVDEAIGNLDVLKAYRLWIRKMDPKVYDGQTESIHISCPIPGHQDDDPSAWINTVKGDGGLWMCGGCQVGGDKYDLAAIGLGFNFQTYKTDGTFRDLKLQMARSLGVDVDSYLLGPAARAYLEQKEHATQDAAPVPTPAPVPRQAQSRENSAQPPVRDNRDKSEIDRIEALNAQIAQEAARDYEERKKKRERERANWDTSARPHPQPDPTAPLITPDIGNPTPTPTKATPEPAPKAPAGMPPPAQGIKGPMPVFMGGLPGLAPQQSKPQASPAPVPAPAPTEPKTEQPKAAPPAIVAPTLMPAVTPLVMPPPGSSNGSLFVGHQPKPAIDVNDPGMIKAMLEDEGIKSGEPDPEGVPVGFSCFDFRNLVPEDTFLGKYCSLLLESDSPDEWNFWNAMAGLSVSVGKRLKMADRTPVFSNLFICLLGETTAGKSISKKYIIELLRKTLPWSGGDPGNTAPRIIRGSASGEKLVEKFRDEVRDPAKPSHVLDVKRVAGFIEYDEFATIMSKASGQGSSFVTILQALFDGYDDVESHSFTTGDKLGIDPFATMLTSTQPSMLRKLLGREHVDNGFLNRFIFAVGREKPLKDENILGGEFMDVSPAGPYLSGIHNWAVQNEGRTIEWSPQAHDMGLEFIRDQVIADKKAHPDNKLIQRADLLVKKFVMLFTLNLRGNRVPVEAVESAMRLYPYLVDTYTILDEALSATENSELRKKILFQIGRLTYRNGKPPSRRELHDALGRSKVDGETLVRAVKTLCELGDLREIQWPLPGMPKVGRPSVRYGLASDD